jgi:hypothetical protein
MTDSREPAEPPAEPPAELPVDLLADLDAGLLEPAEAAEVRDAAARDPQAAAVLAALDSTRAELGALADPPVPAQYAARWEAALAAEVAGAAAPAEAGRTRRDAGDNTRADTRADTGAPDPLPRLRPLSGRRRRAVAQLRRVRPALAAAVVLAAAVIGGVVWTPREPAPLSLDGVDLATAGLAVQGDFDVGPLADPARRARCLSAVAPPGVSPDALLLGGRDVLVDGRHGVLLLLAGGGPGRLHVVVVEPGCGPEGGVLLGTRTIGG